MGFNLAFKGLNNFPEALRFGEFEARGVRPN